MFEPFLPCSPIIILTWFIFSLMSSSGHECFHALRQEYCKQMVGGARGRWDIVPSQLPLSQSSQRAKEYLDMNYCFPNCIPSFGCRAKYFSDAN